MHVAQQRVRGGARRHEALAPLLLVLLPLRPPLGRWCRRGGSGRSSSAAGGRRGGGGGGGGACVIKRAARREAGGDAAKLARVKGVQLFEAQERDVVGLFVLFVGGVRVA